MTKLNAEFRGRVDFAEVAEALGVTTDKVVAAGFLDGGLVAAMYTPDHAEDPLDSIVYRTALRRDREGILRTIAPPEDLGPLAKLLEGYGLPDPRS